MLILLTCRKILTQKMPMSMSSCLLLHAIAAATAMHFQVAKQTCCWRVSVFSASKRGKHRNLQSGSRWDFRQSSFRHPRKFSHTSIESVLTPTVLPRPLFSQIQCIVILLSTLSFSCLLPLLSTSLCATRPACCPSPSRQPTPPGAGTYHLLT